MFIKGFWIPAFAGMTVECDFRLTFFGILTCP